MLPPPFDVLPPADVAGRLPRLRAAIERAGLDALVVTNVVNIRYLSGFTGSAAVMLVGADRCVFATDGRYQTQCAEQLAAAGVDADLAVGRVDYQRRALAKAGVKLSRIGLEAHHVTWAQQREMAEEWFAGKELVPTEELVESLRVVKDPGELARLQAAAHVADSALSHVLPMLLEQPTEDEFALALDFEMRRRGAEGVSFETIVAGGPNGAKPHARPSGRSIDRGELVVIDFGALVEGYHSDMTRTVCVGEPSDPVLLRMVEAVAASQAAGVAAVRAGVAVRAVDGACRAVLRDYGLEDAFLHGTGHGVGLDIHEAPSVNALSVGSLAPGHVVTVEPGVYLPDHGGARIEDTVVVTEEGCEPLTHAPKDLIVT